MEEHIYDVAIVGGGPAGANLARLLGESSLSVLLIDASELQGNKVCAGLLSPDAQRSLARHDIDLPAKVLASPQLFSVRVYDLAEKKSRTRRYLRHYLNLDRAKFDAFLRESIPKNVQRIIGRCLSVQKTEDVFTLSVREGDLVRKVHSRQLVGADGATSAVRHALFPKQRLHKYVAIQEWYDAFNTEAHYSCIFDHTTSESCSWIFPKGESVVFGGAFSSYRCKAAFEKQKEKLIRLGHLPNGTARRTEACMIVRPHLFYGVFLGGNGAYLVGEAAGLISPSSFEGISYALDSSGALAAAILECGANAGAHKILRSYRRKTRALRGKIALKCLKYPFLYQRNLRKWILRTGIGAISEYSAPNTHIYTKENAL